MGTDARSINRMWPVVALLALVALGGLAYGLRGALASSASPSATAGKIVLHVGWTQDPENLNPFVGYANADYEIWHLNYDMLVGYDTDFNPKPELAAADEKLNDWKHNADGTWSWTVRLRKDVQWQDGKPFSARDVAWTYNYIIDNQMGNMLSYVKGIKHVKVVDPYTVEFICDKYKANIGRLWIPILRADQFAGQNPKNADAFNMKMPIIGTGPFQTVAWQPGKFTTMEANPNYWRGKPKVDEIIFATYQNADTMVSDLKAGKLQVIDSPPTATFNALKHNSEGWTAVAWYFRTWDYLSFNCWNGPASKGNPALRDVKFRQALNWAIDKPLICQQTYSGLAVPGSTIMPPGIWQPPLDYHYTPTPDIAYGFDIAKANQLLDAAGYRDTNGDGVREGKDGKPISLRLWARQANQATVTTAKLLSAEFKKIGIKTVISIMSDGAMNNAEFSVVGGGSNFSFKTYSPDYDMYIWDYSGYNDPGDTLSSFTTPQIYWGYNDCNWSNKQYDALWAEQNVERDPQTRVGMIRDMQKLFYTETPQVCLDYPEDLQIYDSRHWTGWVPVLNGKGGVILNSENIDTYLSVHPVAGSQSSSGGSSAVWIVVGAIAALVVIGLGAWLYKRRGRALEE